MPEEIDDRIKLIAGMLSRFEISHGDRSALGSAWGISDNTIQTYFRAAKFHISRQWEPEQVRTYIIDTMEHLAENHPNQAPKACKLLAELYDLKPAKRVEVKVSELDDKQLTERLLGTISKE